MIIAAIHSGTDPAAPLPPAAFHRWLEDSINCPKCEATHILVLDYDHAISRHFANDSRRHLQMLRKAVMLGHSTDHRITHFETNGVVVTSHTPPLPPPVQPISNRIQLIPTRLPPSAPHLCNMGYRAGARERVRFRRPHPTSNPHKTC